MCVCMCVQYAAEIQEFGNGKRKGLHLTFLKPQLHDSGHYVCTASNQFERRVGTVQLSVWLPGTVNSNIKRHVS